MLNDDSFEDSSQTGFPETRKPAPEASAPQGLGRSWQGDSWALLKIAGPNIATMIAQTLLSVVDYAIVSLLPHAAEAQAAVSSSGMIFFTFFALLLGIMICVSTMASQSFGAGRYRDCSAYAWQGVWLSAGFGVLAVFMWPVVPHVYAAIGHEPAVQTMEVAYTRIRFLSLGAAGATASLANFFNGIHRPGVNAVSVAVSNTLNAVLSYGLVLGKWGLPEMGVEGAAWGTLIATCFRTAWMLCVLCFAHQASRFEPLKAWRYDADKMRRLLRVGWPAGAAMVFDIGAWAVFLTGLIGRFGTTHLAATSTVWRYLELSFMPAVGIGAAVTAMVGKSVGQGRPDLARRLAFVGGIINAAYMSSMAILYTVLGDNLVGVFNRDPDVIALGQRLLMFAAVFQFFDAFAITYGSALRGAGDTRWPAIVAASEAWLLMVCGGTWVVRYHPEFGSSGPWFFATAFIVAVGLTLWFRWQRGRWEQLDVIGRAEPAGFEVAPVPVEMAVDEDAVLPVDAGDPIGVEER